MVLGPTLRCYVRTARTGGRAGQQSRREAGGRIKTIFFNMHTHFFISYKSKSPMYISRQGGAVALHSLSYLLLPRCSR